MKDAYMKLIERVSDLSEKFYEEEVKLPRNH
jgi:hypothetical protein